MLHRASGIALIIIMFTTVISSVTFGIYMAFTTPVAKGMHTAFTTPMPKNMHTALTTPVAKNIYLFQY